MTEKTLATSEIVFRDDLYPRIETNATTVQKYAEDLSVLPPIEVNQHNELIDGWHRWTAHKKSKVDDIPVVVTETADDMELLELAIQRNAAFGLQLSRQDKMTMARNIYHRTPMDERGQVKDRLSTLLSVSYATVNKWLSRIDKDEQEARNASAMDLWLRCYTEAEIANQLGMPQQTLSDGVLPGIKEYKIPVIPGIFTENQPGEDQPQAVRDKWEQERQAKINEHNEANANHDTEFTVPVYNIWKQQNKTDAGEHFGNSEVTWVDRLLYFYTQPFDIVVDPFAGSGSTLDICRTRLRRCWLSDRLPIEERAKDIRTLDITTGLPDLRKRWKDVSLVYLDPPYWKQAVGQYDAEEGTPDPTNLANMELDAFTETLAGIVKGFAKKLSNAYIALIIQPTQWNAPEHHFTDHVGDMLRAVKLPVDLRYSVPYESQQYNAQMVTWAKENKRCLVLTREIIVWRVE